ncbi:MAG: flippase [Flavobacteriales bacterium]|nr:flippase [Flavobacteriales bacterium]
MKFIGYDLGATLKLPFVKNVIHTLASKWITILIGLVPVMLVTRALGPEGKGKYALIIQTIGVLMQLSNLGLHSSNTYQVSKNRNLLPKLYTNSIAWIISTSGLAFALFAFANYLYPTKVSMFQGGFVYIAIGTLAYFTSIVGQNLNIAIDNIRKVNILNIVAKAITLVLIVVLYYEKNLTLFYAIRIAILEFTILGIANFVIARRSFEKMVYKIDFNVLKPTFTYGLRIYAIGLLGYMVIRSDVYLIKYYLGDGAVGYYSSAVQIIDQISIFAVVISSLLMPKLTSEMDPTERYRLNKRSFNHLLLIMLLGCATAFILSEHIILILFGKEFLAAVASFRVLLLAIFFLSLTTSMSQYLASIGLPSRLIFCWIIVFFVNITFNKFFIPEYGEIGAAYSSLISYFIIFICVIQMVYRHGKKIPKQN